MPTTSGPSPVTNVNYSAPQSLGGNRFRTRITWTPPTSESTGYSYYVELFEQTTGTRLAHGTTMLTFIDLDFERAVIDLYRIKVTSTKVAETPSFVIIEDIVKHSI